MSFLAGGERPRRIGGHATSDVELRRSTRSNVVCSGTLACRNCDAPIAAGPDGLSLSDELACPYCRRRGRVRDFLSLSAPTRPARVVVRVQFP